jgi:hypothetical protein
MSRLGSYKNTTFNESQKFLVLDPSTSSASLVLASELVAYITPQIGSVKAESTRLSAENTDYKVGEIIQTSGATVVGSLAAVYLVVAGGAGDFPMLNGNDLLVLIGDDALRAQLISQTAGQGASLVSMEGGPTVEAAVTNLQDSIGDFVTRTEIASQAIGEGASLVSMEGGPTVEAAVLARASSAVLASPAASEGASLISMEGGPTVEAAILALAASATEIEDLKVQAALMDPAAYVHIYGPVWSVTIPAGETWYVVNAWYVSINGSPKSFHRELATAVALELPAGTVIESSSGPSQDGFLYFCRPALVTGDSRYDTPQTLINDRKALLKTLAINHASASIPLGSARATKATTAFDTDFEDGMLAHVSTFDVSWTILKTPLSAGFANTQFEISDDHQMRSDAPLMTPFYRPNAPSMQVRAGSISGNTSETSLAGTGTLSYYKLPASWRADVVKPYEAAVLALSPTRYYKLDEASGATASDSGSVGANGTYAGDITLGLDGAPAEGRTAAYLGGTTSLIQTPAGSDINFGTGNWTVEFWVKFDTATVAAGYDPYIINAWNTATTSDNSFLVGIKNQFFSLLVTDTGASTIEVGSTVTVLADVLYHVIAGRDGVNTFIRVVGQESRQTTAIGTAEIAAAPSGLQLGTGYSTGTYTYPVVGILDEVAFYPTALTDVQADVLQALSLRNP